MRAGRGRTSLLGPRPARVTGSDLGLRDDTSMADLTDMNSFIRQASGRGERRQVGLVDRLRGTSALSADRRERLNLALANYEDAARREDPIAAEIPDEKIEKLLAESRAAQEPAPSAGEPAAAPAVNFDSGVRRPVSRTAPPNMNEVIGRSRAERRAVAASSHD